MVSNKIVKADPSQYVKVIDGVTRRSVVYGEKTLLCEFKLEKGAVIPMHTHPHEQTGFLVSGKILFTVDGKEYQMNPGDSWCVLGDVEHKVEVLEDSFLVEVFSPVREEFIAKD